MGQTQQAPAPGSLADASLEDLMNIEVTSVSKKAQRLSSTAASAFFITAEDIRRSGLELPEVLRLAPGVQVARVEAGRWAVSIRGFNNDFSNKDDLSLVPGKLHFIAGARNSYETAARLQIQPTGRLLWTPTSNLTTWAAVSRAVHTPSVTKRSLDATLADVPLAPPMFGLVKLVSNSDTRAEVALSYEAGQRIQITHKISLDASAFYTVDQRLIGFDSLTPYFVPAGGSQMAHTVFPELQTNVRDGASEGYELSVTASVNSRWRLTAGSEWLRIHTHAYTGTLTSDMVTDGGTSPHDQHELRSAMDLTKKLQLDTSIYFVAALPEEKVPQYFRLDVRLAWRPMERLELSTSVQDALDPQHPEMYSQRLAGLEQVQRNIYGKTTWRF